MSLGTPSQSFLLPSGRFETKLTKEIDEGGRGNSKEGQ